MWSNEPMEILGVIIDCEQGTRMMEENYLPIKAKMLTVCTDWYNRTLSLVGKVRVVNTLIGSLFAYKMNIMLNLSEAYIKEIESCINNFLWHGKRAKISLKVLQLDYKDGGLRLTNIRARQAAHKIKWIYKLRNLDFLKECAYQRLSPTLRDTIWLCNLQEKDVRKLFDTKNNFWAQVLLAWAGHSLLVSRNQR